MSKLSTTIRFLLLSALLLSCGCGLWDDDSDSDTPSDEPRSYWRVDLRADSADVEVLGVSKLDLPPGAAVPHADTGGQHVAVTFDGDEVLEAVPVNFPTSTLLEGSYGDGFQFSGTLSHASSSASVFLRASDEVDRVEVLAADGSAVVTLSASELAEHRTIAGELTPGVRRQALSPALDHLLPHVYLLEPGEEPVLSDDYFPDYVDSIVAPTPEMVAALEEGLANVSEKARSAIKVIAVVRMPQKGCIGVSSVCGDGDPSSQKGFCAEQGLIQTDDDGNPMFTGVITGAATGSQLILNVDQMANWKSTIPHESVHVLNNLLDAASGAEALDIKWSPEVVAAARDTVREYRIGHGLTRAWASMHGSAVEVQKAFDFAGQEWCSYSASDALAGGFLTPYGTKTPNEDIAEYASTIQVENNPIVCSLFKAHTGNDFPSELAIFYAKLFLLKELGAIEEDAFERCVGNTTIDGPPGIHLGDAISFSSGLKSGYHTNDRGVPLFSVLGRGPDSYKILIEAVTPRGGSPLGLHRLDNIFWATVNLSENGVYLAHDDDFKARASGGGLLLITEASDDLTEGAIFFLTLQNAFGGTTDVFPFSTFEIRN